MNVCVAPPNKVNELSIWLSILANAVRFSLLVEDLNRPNFSQEYGSRLPGEVEYNFNQRLSDVQSAFDVLKKKGM